MKLVLLVALFVGLSTSIYSDPFWVTTLQNFEIVGYYQDKSIFTEYKYPRNPFYIQKIYKNIKNLADGYYYLEFPALLGINNYEKTFLFESEEKNYNRMYLLEGKGLIFRYFFSKDEILERKEVTKESIERWKNERFSKGKRINIFDTAYTTIESGVIKISSSSFLEEGGIKYSSDFIITKIFIVETEDGWFLEYDNITPPWVEGVEDYGIGEYLDIEFKYASDEIQILNGFVDFSRMHLYKDNSRVKRVLIESVEPAFKQEYELEDVVRYNVISLPRKTAKIRMTILDVYPGRKYKDTCISSILVTDPNQPPYEEQKAKIIALMKKNGVWEKIEDYKRQLQ